MRLVSLNVDRLYGKYNYNVDFNKDITMLYGKNGCGKTTVLNLITDIITGQIYKLFYYEFNNIELIYSKDGKAAKKRIYIERIDDSLVVEFKKEITQIEQLQIADEKRRHSRFDEVWMTYKETYPVLGLIQNEFNYVYLSLDRSSELRGEEDFYYRRRVMNFEEVHEPEIVDPEIRNVEVLVYKANSRIVGEVTKINDEFRNMILKSAMNLNREDAGTVPVIQKHEIDRTAASYFKILRDLNLADEEEMQRYRVFFDNCKKNAEKDTSELDNIISYIFQCYEMEKIREIVRIAEEAERKKQLEVKSIELFLETVNEFIFHSDLKKTIEIDPLFGRIYFTADDRQKKLSIQYLSSGERQLIIFFANLVFGVDKNTTGIFVVDEPELSLHLSWQKVFIEKALQVNKNVQFIFATHAPEIVGNRRDKIKKLERILAD